MRTRYFIPTLLLLLSSVLLSACEVVGASASTSLGAITPRDTSASTLLVTIDITEDQDATDGRSTVTLQFRTAAVAEDNMVRFTHQEAVTCNGVTVPLNDAPTYTLNVAQGGYICSYTGYTPGTGQLAPVTMIDIAARSKLSPQQPTVSSKGVHDQLHLRFTCARLSPDSRCGRWCREQYPWSCFSKRSRRLPGSRHQFLDRARNHPLAKDLFVEPA